MNVPISNLKFQNHIIYMYLLKIIKGKIILKGQKSVYFFQKLHNLVHISQYFYVSFPYFLTFSILNIVPFLKLYKTKVHKKSKKKIEKVKQISVITGVNIAVNWIFENISNSKSFESFILDFFFELCDAFFKTGKIYQKKFDYYKQCLDTRFFIK